MPIFRRKQEAVDHSHVQKYYSRLAAEYNALANQTCEQVYRQLVRKTAAWTPPGGPAPSPI